MTFGVQHNSMIQLCSGCRHKVDRVRMAHNSGRCFMVTEILRVVKYFGKYTQPPRRTRRTRLGWRRGLVNSYLDLLSEDGPWASDTVTYTNINRLRKSLTVC